MRCTNCGEVISGEPIWEEGEPYCCQECADEMTLEEDEDDYEEDEEYEEGEEEKR